MAGLAATQPHTMVLRATVYPACECGRAYTAHIAGDCQHYRPSRPIEDWGTRSVTYGAGMPVLRRLVCETLWAIESRIQRWRESFARS